MWMCISRRLHLSLYRDFPRIFASLEPAELVVLAVEVGEVAVVVVAEVLLWAPPD